MQAQARLRSSGTFWQRVLAVVTIKVAFQGQEGSFFLNVQFVKSLFSKRQVYRWMVLADRQASAYRAFTYSCT